MKAWSENANGPGAANFITGMGGYLQSIIFGYGGLRVYEDKMVIKGNLPLSVTSMKVIGLDYLGGSIDIQFTDTVTIVTMTKRAIRALKAEESSSGKLDHLVVGHSYTYNLDRVCISPL